MFPLQFCEMWHFWITWNTTSCERKTYIAINWRRFEIDVFPLGVVSICNFILHKLRVNGNPPNEDSQSETVPWLSIVNSRCFDESYEWSPKIPPLPQEKISLQNSTKNILVSIAYFPVHHNSTRVHFSTIHSFKLYEGLNWRLELCTVRGVAT